MSAVSNEDMFKDQPREIITMITSYLVFNDVFNLRHALQFDKRTHSRASSKIRLYSHREVRGLEFQRLLYICYKEFKLLKKDLSEHSNILSYYAYENDINRENLEYYANSCRLVNIEKQTTKVKGVLMDLVQRILNFTAGFVRLITVLGNIGVLESCAENPGSIFGTLRHREWNRFTKMNLYEYGFHRVLLRVPVFMDEWLPKVDKDYLSSILTVFLEHSEVLISKDVIKFVLPALLFKRKFSFELRCHAIVCFVNSRRSLTKLLVPERNEDDKKDDTKLISLIISTLNSIVTEDDVDTVSKKKVSASRRHRAIINSVYLMDIYNQEAVAILISNVVSLAIHKKRKDDLSSLYEIVVRNRNSVNSFERLTGFTLRNLVRKKYYDMIEHLLMIGAFCNWEMSRLLYYLKISVRYDLNPNEPNVARERLIKKLSSDVHTFTKVSNTRICSSCAVSKFQVENCMMLRNHVPLTVSQYQTEEDKNREAYACLAITYAQPYYSENPHFIAMHAAFIRS